MAEWEPGDDICPPWPWPWHGPRPPWWVELVDEGRQVFVGLTLINVAANVRDPKVGLQVAKIGAQVVHQHAQELSRALEKAPG